MRHSKDKYGTLKTSEELDSSTDSKFEKYWRREERSVGRAGPGGLKNNLGSGSRARARARARPGPW